MASPVSSEFPEKLSIAIVGGGIGGLAAAVALQQKGFKVTVYERDSRFGDRRQGYGLTLTNNKKGPLAELGLLQKCVKEDCPSNAHWVFNPQGDILGYYGRVFKRDCRNILESDINLGREMNAEDVNRGNLRIPRETLRKMLLEKLEPDSIIWGVKLIDYEENLSGVRLKLEKTKNCYDPSDRSLTEASSEIDSGRPREEDVNIEYIEAEANLLVGADGTRSIVRRLRASKDFCAKKRKRDDIEEASVIEKDPDPSPLRYLGVSVILGITTAQHPLINRQGFYVLDGENRFFTMPFEEGIAATEGDDDAAASTNAECPTEIKAPRPQLTMWQLSFSGVLENEAKLFKSARPEDLLAEAKKRTSTWFSPVSEMLANTPLKEVWGTALYDRDPMPLRTRDQRPCRVTVIGDACHPMSMFKGQGANQALQDGPLLADWLSRPGLTPENLFTRLRCFEREMVSRVSGKVAASRIAAAHLHSPAALADEYGIEGVQGADTMQSVLGLLKERCIGAATASTGESEERIERKEYILEKKVLDIIKAVESEAEVRTDVESSD